MSVISHVIPLGASGNSTSLSSALRGTFNSPSNSQIKNGNMSNGDIHSPNYTQSALRSPS
ncbi:hypothetical protein AMTR_s00345p00014470, partial [Amborella trichopoda]